MFIPNLFAIWTNFHCLCQYRPYPQQVCCLIGCLYFWIEAIFSLAAQVGAERSKCNLVKSAESILMCSSRLTADMMSVASSHPNAFIVTRRTEIRRASHVQTSTRKATLNRNKTCVLGCSSSTLGSNDMSKVFIMTLSNSKDRRNKGESRVMQRQDWIYTYQMPG